MNRNIFKPSDDMNIFQEFIFLQRFD